MKGTGTDNMKYYTPTELGRILGISNRSVNKTLEAAGFQEPRTAVFASLNHAESKVWEPTPIGLEFSMESNSQWPGLRWSPEIIPILQEQLKTQ